MRSFQVSHSNLNFHWNFKGFVLIHKICDQIWYLKLNHVFNQSVVFSSVFLQFLIICLVTRILSKVCTFSGLNFSTKLIAKCTEQPKIKKFTLKIRRKFVDDFQFLTTFECENVWKIPWCEWFFYIYAYICKVKPFFKLLLLLLSWWYFNWIWLRL